MEDDEAIEDAIERELTEETRRRVESTVPELAVFWVFPEKTMTNIVFAVDLGEHVQEPSDEVVTVESFTDLPDEISFHESGRDAYEYILTKVEQEESGTDYFDHVPWDKMTIVSSTTGLHSPLRRFVISGVVCLVVVALVGLASVPAAATTLRVPELDVTSQCDPSLDTVSVAGQSHSVRENHAMLFSGADEVTLHVDSAIAGYPAPERHAQLFAGADTESLEVDSAIAGYPAPEAHAILFAGAETELPTDEAVSDDRPSG